MALDTAPGTGSTITSGSGAAGVVSGVAFHDAGPAPPGSGAAGSPLVPS
ncbi:MAG: hypothetical protein V7646_5264 [Pseudonocardia sp.]